VWLLKRSGERSRNYYNWYCAKGRTFVLKIISPHQLSQLGFPTNDHKINKIRHHYITTLHYYFKLTLLNLTKSNVSDAFVCLDHTLSRSHSFGSAIRTSQATTLQTVGLLYKSVGRLICVSQVSPQPKLKVVIDMILSCTTPRNKRPPLPKAKAHMLSNKPSNRTRPPLDRMSSTSDTHGYKIRSPLRINADRHFDMQCLVPIWTTILQLMSRKTSNICTELTKLPLDENQSRNRSFLPCGSTFPDNYGQYIPKLIRPGPTLPRWLVSEFCKTTRTVEVGDKRFNLYRYTLNRKKEPKKESSIDSRTCRQLLLITTAN
jgi:hypothetical protein